MVAKDTQEKAVKGLSSDGKIIFLNRGIRSFGYGFISVILGIYLKELGLDLTTIGLLLGTTIIGGAVFTLVAGKYAPKYGIKKMLLLSMLLSLAGISIFIITDNPVFLFFASFIGFLSPSGRELGPFLSLEQAYLPFTVPSNERTKAFSNWNIIAVLSSSLGGLFASLPIILQGFGIEKLFSFRLIFLAYFALNVIALLLYTRIREVEFRKKEVVLSEKSRKAVTGLSLLFAIDSLGGGLVIKSTVALWFYSRFSAPLTSLSALFFAAGLLEAFSYYLSGKLAKKIGLLKTMVSTHITSSIFLIAIPFMPSLTLAAAFYLLRQLLSEMDVPARQSYVVAIVEPEETTMAASITNVAKILATSIGPTLSGLLAFTPLSPFVAAGTLKIGYDIMLYLRFKKIKPPEEKD